MRLNFLILHFFSDTHLIIVKYLQNILWSQPSLVNVNPRQTAMSDRTFQWFHLLYLKMILTSFVILHFLLIHSIFIF